MEARHFHAGNARFDAHQSKMTPTAEIYPESGARESGKTRRNFVMTEAKAAACRLGKCLGLPFTHRNLYVWALAIEAESNFSSISIREATDRIITIARTALQCGECLDYFWFEDCCWRHPKLSFRERDDLRMREKARWY